MTDAMTDNDHPASEPDSDPSKRGSCLKKLFYFLIFIGIAGLVSSFFMLEYVRPNEFGIMEKKIGFGFKLGIQEKPYSAGYHIVLPYSFWVLHRLPKDIQVLELTNHPQQAAKSAHMIGAAHIRTNDGFYVDVDISILYQIKDPYKVFVTFGAEKGYEKDGIIPDTADILRDTLGVLTTEEFFNSPLRVQKAEEAKNILNAQLSIHGIEVKHVLVRYFNYSEEIQKNIEEKKLKDQLVFKNQAEAKSATEEATVKKITEEGKAAVSVEFEKGKAYVTLKTAERNQYARKKKAEADLLIQLAEAEKVRLKNQALEGIGATRMVGLKMAEVYKGLDVIILPSDGPNGVNPLDLDNTLRLFDVQKGGTP